MTYNLIVPLAVDDVCILDSQSCQVVTFVTHKIFENWPDISAGRKVPFVVDRRRKSLFPNGSRHSAPFRPTAASHDWRRAEGKKMGKSERAWDSICIQYWFQSDIVDFHFCDLLLTVAALALSVLRKRVFFEGQPPMHTDVALSSIKYRAINNLPSRWYTSLSILAMRDSSLLSDRGNGKLFGYSYQLP